MEEIRTKYRAGDLVSQAIPRLAARMRVKSRRGYFIRRRNIKNERLTRAERRLSGRASLSKKKV